MICSNPKCGNLGEGKFCSLCGNEMVPIPDDAQTLYVCNGIKDNSSPCKAELKMSQNFCSECGTRIDKRMFMSNVCRSCGQIFEKGSKFCSSCGTNTTLTGDNPQKQDMPQKEDNPQGQNMPKKEDNPNGQDDSASEEENKSARRAEAKEMEKAIKSGPGINVDEIKRIRTAADGGANKVKEYVNAKLDEWKTIPLHVGVIGNSGVGKSSFINALRDVKKGQKGYAEVDVKETTTELTPYTHPQNKSLVFWDMPGVGTPKYPQAEYLEKVKFKSYDFLLILTCTRFTENDLWLAREAQKENKAFYFIRTKIDLDVLNDKMDDPDNHTEEAVVTRIRESSEEELKKANIDTNRLFLISNKGKWQKSYDFRKLVNSLLEVLPRKKQEVWTLSLTSLTEEVIFAKRNFLRKRILVLSLSSAAAGAVPLPGIGAIVDTGIILAEAEEYKRQFGLNEEQLLRNNPKYAGLIGQKYSQNIAQLLAGLSVDEATESAVKYGIPFLGSLVSGTISYGITVMMLWRLLNSMVSDALMLNEEAIKRIASETHA